MTIPTLVFALLIASLYGALYHLIRGGGLGRLILFIFFSWLGFTLGHSVGIWQEWLFIPMGQLNLGMSTFGSVVLLIIADWGSRLKTGNSQTFSDNGNEV